MEFDPLRIGLTLAGGLIGSQSNNSSTTAKQSMDPRMDAYVYGKDGASGLMDDRWKLYQSQMQEGGLNPLQRQGLEMQRQYLMSPQYSQGYADMTSMGRGLMQQGIASNPFTNGSGLRAPTGAMGGLGGLGGVTRPAASQAPAFQYSGDMNAQFQKQDTKPSLLSPESEAQIQRLVGDGGQQGSGYRPDPNGGTAGNGTNLTDAQWAAVTPLRDEQGWGNAYDKAGLATLMAVGGGALGDAQNGRDAQYTALNNYMNNSATTSPVYRGSAQGTALPSMSESDGYGTYNTSGSWY